MSYSNGNSSTIPGRNALVEMLGQEAAKILDKSGLITDTNGIKSLSENH